MMTINSLVLAHRANTAILTIQRVLLFALHSSVPNQTALVARKLTEENCDLSIKKFCAALSTFSLSLTKSPIFVFWCTSCKDNQCFGWIVR